MRVSETVVLYVLLRSLLLEILCVIASATHPFPASPQDLRLPTKVTILRLARLQFHFEFGDALPHLFALAVGATLLCSPLLKRRVLVLHIDKVEDDIKDTSENKGKEQGCAGQIHCE